MRTSSAQWRLCTVGELAASIQYGYTAKAIAGIGGPRYLRITDIQNDHVDWSNVPSCEIDEASVGKYRLAAGDVVFARTGATVGKSFLIRSDVPEAVFASYLIRIRFLRDVDPRYVAYFFQSPSYWRQIEESQAGIGQPNVNGKKLAGVRLPVPPQDEQHRIVAEIEKQFSRLDDAVSNLQRVKANLKRYEAAILESATEGRLVANEAERARDEGCAYQSGEDLLLRVVDARRRQWKGRRKYEAPPPPVLSGLPELPRGWAWARLDAIASIKGGITVDKKRSDPSARPVPYLRVANVQRGHLELDEVKLIDAPERDIQELRLLPGDILFNEGGDRDKLGRGWIWEGQLPECIHQNHVFRARPDVSSVLPKFISWWGNTFGRDYFLREGKQTTNLASINMTKLAALPVPLPPFAEQTRIVEEVERQLSIIAALEYTVSTRLDAGNQLRNSIVQKAFLESHECGRAEKSACS